MQRIFPLTDGSAIEITTAVYNPPTSPSFDGEGVRPDFDVKMNDDSMPGNLLNRSRSSRRRWIRSSRPSA